MIKYTFAIIMLCFFNNQRPVVNEYTYRCTDCIGLQSPMDIYYRNKKVGVLNGIRADNDGCYGKLKFSKDFKLVQSMQIHKIVPLISNSYLKIANDKTNVSRIKILNTDTVNILSPG